MSLEEQGQEQKQEIAGKRTRNEEAAIDDAVNICLTEIWDSRAKAINKCAATLEGIGLSRPAICVELIHRLKGFVAERTIRRALGPEYKHEYNNDKRSKKSKLAKMAELKEREIIDAEGKALAETLGIQNDELEELEPADPLAKHWKNKFLMVKDERDYWRGKAEQLQAKLDAVKMLQYRPKEIEN